MATFLSLPLEDVIFPQILSQLTTLEVWSLRLVSRDFYSIVYQYYATNCYKVDLIKLEKLSVHIVCRILTHCQRLKQLRLNGDCFRHPDDIKTKGDLILLSLERTRPSLFVLHLQSLLLSGTAVDILKDCCKHIKRLSLIDITVEGKPNEMSNIISDDCTSLEEIRIVDCSFSHHRLQTILPEQKELTILEVQKILIINIDLMYIGHGVTVICNSNSLFSFMFKFKLILIKTEIFQNLARL